MKSYNIKCIGCGSVLNDDSNKLGYVQKFDDKKTKYCKRCFDLIYYQKIDNSNLNQDVINQNINNLKLSSKECVFHILDVLNLDKSINKNLLNSECNIYFVVNKMDCLPKKYNATITNEYIYKTIQSFGFIDPKIIYVSVNNKSSIKRLYSFIKQVSRNKQKVIFIGNTNVGKSSLINALKKINDQNDNLTVSPYINTTINFKKNKIEKNEIIDTPGSVSNENIQNYLDLKFIKKLTNFKKNHPINFYINPNQSILIEGLVLISYIDGLKANFTFYISNELKIWRMKTENAERNLTNEFQDVNVINYKDKNIEFKEYEFNLDSNYKHNISIEGLGLISLNKGIKLIKIKLPSQVGINLNKYAII